MGLFKPRLVDSEVVEWQFEYFEWLIDNFSSAPGLPDSELWRPIPEHFVPTDVGKRPLSGRPLVKNIFNSVKKKCHFDSEQIFRLVPSDEAKPQSLGGVAMVQTNEQGACGRYQIKTNEDGSYSETITYDRDLTEDPVQLIATFAHELSHALHVRSREPVDIEPELYEMFTDLTAVYLGFGIFTANTRFNFSAYQDADIQGWQAKGAGYLPEADIIFATALFMKIKNIPQEIGSEYLKSRLRKSLKKAFKQLSFYETEVKALRCRKPAAIEALDSDSAQDYTPPTT